MSNPFSLTQIKNVALRRVIQKISKIDVLEVLYNDWLKHLSDNPDEPTVGGKRRNKASDFIEYCLGCLDVKSDVINPEHFDNVPKTGPLVIVANHPLGGLEGVLLTYMLLKIRPDLKVLTNELLKNIPEFHDVFIGVDVLNQGKQRENAKGMREVAKHLSHDGALLVFPAGTVSRIQLPSLTISDAPWSYMITRLARKYSAPILPIFVEGENSRAFYLSGLIHKRLRTMLLPRAMLSKSGQEIPLHIGDMIHASDIKRLKNDKIATSYVRLCCEVLASKNETQDQPEDSLTMHDLKQDVDIDIVTNHINSLEDYLLYSEDKFSVYCTPYDALGPVKEQLAIERERTFRLVDEGTGRELDTDQFDSHYQHLFLWDKEAQKIAGGYRIGVTKDVIKDKGLHGLYSHSLFHYDQKFIEKMGNTVEVGRSFVTEDYQRHPKALDMLWKGIGRFIADNPENHTLFGCVSISRQYSPLGTALLTQTFLSHHGVDDKLQRKVKARKPLKNLDTPWTQEQIKNLSEIPVLSKLVGRIDVNKSIPILIRHYLSLGGKFLSFTVNEGFNSSLDGLIIVDLRQTKDKYLKRYMGEEKLKQFRTKWQSKKDKKDAT